MEQKNCPDPRNCSKIHYFGKCPYKHQPCNRGTACPYVNQNNCQFYHPEEDYPQYKNKKTTKLKKEKRKSIITTLKIVTKPSATQLASMASKAFAEMAALPTSQPNKSNKIIQPIVKVVQQNQKQAAPAQKLPEKRRVMGSSPMLREKSGQIVKSNEPKIPNYITIKMKEQEMYIRDLERRIETTERTAEIDRGRAAEMESTKQKFFDSWSRAVKTLERIRESKTFLDESVARAIDHHSAALRRHEGFTIYAPGLADLNPSVKKLEYLSHKGRRFPEEELFPHGGWDNFGVSENSNSMFIHEPGLAYSDKVHRKTRTVDNLLQYVASDMWSTLEL